MRPRAGASRASSVSPTLPQTKSLWGEGRRLPGTARQLGCVRERVPVCRCVLRGTGVAQGHGKSFLSFGFPCTLPRDYAEAKAKANTVLPEPGALVQKVPWSPAASAHRSAGEGKTQGVQSWKGHINQRFLSLWLRAKCCPGFPCMSTDA